MHTVPQTLIPSTMHAHLVEARFYFAGKRPSFRALWKLGSLVLLHLHGRCRDRDAAIQLCGDAPDTLRTAVLFDKVLRGEPLLEQPLTADLCTYGDKWMSQIPISDDLHAAIQARGGLKKAIRPKCTWEDWTLLSYLLVLYLVGRCPDKASAWRLLGGPSISGGMFDRLMQGKTLV